DGIDVLIDLNGYTTHARSEIFVSRPAPLQVSWLGYLGTLGAPWYDYVLTDRFVLPPAQQAFFTERALYLPDCYCPSDTRRPVAPDAPDRAACGLPAEGVVFCCFNNSYKILPQLFDVWMRLLDALPGSVLWLSPGQATAAVNLRREAAARGVDPARLVFAPRVSLPEHLARHVHADLFLDTTPYNAGTTANDALFMGVPVLTCAGDTMASRVAGSQLTAIGLPELITTSLAAYEALALALARDRPLLAGYRQRLEVNRRTSVLFDMARFTRALADLLRRAQASLARGGAGEAIDLLQRAVALDPGNAEAAFHLGNLLAMRGDTAPAIAAYEHALELAPEHAQLRVNLGITLGQSGNVAAAERAFTDVLSREPAHADAL